MSIAVASADTGAQASVYCSAG